VLVALNSGSAAVEKNPQSSVVVGPSHQISLTQENSPVQLADEITRRLRRMGINILKTRIDRPYDTEGELC
jgi:hypothetical protein